MRVLSDDTFARPDGPVGNGWVASTPGVYAVASGALACTTANASGVNADFLARPNSEVALDARLDVTFEPPQGGPGQPVYFTLNVRYDPATGNSYFGQFYPAAGQFFIYSRVAGVNNNIAVPTIPGMDASHRYALSLRAEGVNPTTVSWQLTDLTTDTITNGTVVDSTDALKVPGGFALSCASASGVSATAVVSEVTTYDLAASPPDLLRLLTCD